MDLDDGINILEIIKIFIHGIFMNLKRNINHFKIIYQVKIENEFHDLKKF